LAQIRLHGAKDELVDEVVALSTRFGIITPYTSFLVEEPQMVLTDSGRQQLSQTLQAPVAAAAPGYGGAGPALAPEVRSGAQADERAMVGGLATSDQAASPVARVKQIADKTFCCRMAWVNAADGAMRAEGTRNDGYFQRWRSPEMSVTFAGDRVWSCFVATPASVRQEMPPSYQLPHRRAP
jgi:Ca-activated chloride channel family protein